MNESLENIIIEIDPTFFQHAISCKNGEENETDTCMAFGLECGDGWFEPIKRMVQKISFLNHSGQSDGVSIICDQIKEKWGLLTVYYHIDSDPKKCNEEIAQDYSNLVDMIVDNATEECKKYCEWCGNKETITNPIVCTDEIYTSFVCFDCAFKHRHYNDRSSINTNGIFYFMDEYHDWRFDFNGHRFNSVAQAFFYTICDKKYKDVFMKIKSTQQLRELAKCLISKKEINSFISVEVMRDILKEKFSDSQLLELLRKTGDLPIELYNYYRIHDNFWGSCPCKDCQNEEKHNFYGKILMGIRKGL